MNEETHPQSDEKPQISSFYLVAIFLVSAASLCYEINLTRLLSVTQFYHFAFLIVSLALLGYGISGVFLAIFPKVSSKYIGYLLLLLAFFTSISFIFAYWLTNYLPFDSFSISLDWKQIGILLVHLIVFTMPFFFSGLSNILLINQFEDQTNLIYGINLIGSAFGCLIALILPSILGAEGVVVICTILAMISFLILLRKQDRKHSISQLKSIVIQIVSISLFIFCLTDIYLRVFQGTNIDLMDIKISPYKGISYALQYPGTEIIFQKWNAYSRVDLLRSDGFHSYPGYSYISGALPPKQDALFIDGDDLSPVITLRDELSTLSYLPSAIAYNLRQNADVLILEPRGGLEIVVAYSEGADNIMSAEPNELVIEAARSIYESEYLVNYVQSGRSYLKGCNNLFDVIVISLNSSFHPIRSGAYSLGEDYRYTIEAFEEALLHLEENGILLITRWLQTPPSEFLKVFGTAIEVIERNNGSPDQQIAAFRSYNTGTVLIKNGNITSGEGKIILEFTQNRAYDAIYYPGIQQSEVNINNKLPEAYYFELFTSLLQSPSRAEWYREYTYDVTPPSDDKPFFNQFFKWSQIPNILVEFGRVWEPFGGAGFVILLILLAITMIFALSILLVPTMISIKTKIFSLTDLGNLGYFAAIGLAFMLVEIPLIQNFILFLNNPSYAMTTVLFSLLLFSGIGSRTSKLLSINIVYFCLISFGLLDILVLKQVMYYGLGYPLILRIFVTVILLAPIGYFMGMPFPKGIELLVKSSVNRIAWAWSINGAFSVVAGVIAALIAISFGFKVVLIVGVICYSIAWILLRVLHLRQQHHCL